MLKNGPLRTALDASGVAHVLALCLSGYVQRPLTAVPTLRTMAGHGSAGTHREQALVFYALTATPTGRAITRLQVVLYLWGARRPLRAAIEDINWASIKSFPPPNMAKIVYAPDNRGESLLEY
jgi:hypothetical protein